MSGCGGSAGKNDRQAEQQRLELLHFTVPETERFRERTTAERVNARIKDEFGGRFVRVRGHAKVLAHLMFGLLALTADQLLRLLNRPEGFMRSSVQKKALKQGLMEACWLLAVLG